jgi:DNA-binding response OmpR family regulator
MIRVLIIAREDEAQSELRKSLSRHDLKCYFISPGEDLPHAVDSRQPDILLYEMDTPVPASEIWEPLKRLKKEKDLPLIALVPEKLLDSVDGRLEYDDFLTGPYNAGELILRINRLVHKVDVKDSSEIIVYNDLIIDLATCEVSLEGKIVELTFKEYEMLKLLAGNPGRVYTRQTLLDKIWSYDYYGGDRTVDVHVRRLRSKIEDINHSFIETVRNMGYRFVKKS